MLFLADESCDFAVVRTLRAAGHDVVAVAEISPRACVLRVGKDVDELLAVEEAFEHGSGKEAECSRLIDLLN